MLPPEYTVLDSTGALVRHVEYTAFGRHANGTAPITDFLFGFTGRPFDDATGLYDYRARWYDPEVGRFASEDPLGFAAGDANLYRYVGNSPIDYVDPSGMSWLSNLWRKVSDDVGDFLSDVGDFFEKQWHHGTIQDILVGTGVVLTLGAPLVAGFSAGLNGGVLAGISEFLAGVTGTVSLSGTGSQWGASLTLAAVDRPGSSNSAGSGSATASSDREPVPAVSTGESVAVQALGPGGGGSAFGLHCELMGINLHPIWFQPSSTPLAGGPLDAAERNLRAFLSEGAFDAAERNLREALAAESRAGARASACGHGTVPNVAVSSPGYCQYLLDAAATTFVGEYAGAPTNALGVVGSVAFGLTGLDVYKDVADIVHGFHHWEWTRSHVAAQALNLVAVLPLVGAVKNFRYADELMDAGKAGARSLDHAATVGKVAPGAELAHPPGSLGAAKAWTMKGRLKAANLPTSGKIRYVPPKGHPPTQPLPRGPNNGFLDRFGNEWTKGPSRTAGQPFEWDVQIGRNATPGMRNLSRDGRHVNVSMGGEVTH